MKKNAIRILSLFLVVMTLVGVISLPVSAYSYPMNYTITYKTKSGKVLGTNSGTVDGAAETRNALRITSPSYDRQKNRLCQEDESPARFHPAFPRRSSAGAACPPAPPVQRAGAF